VIKRRDQMPLDGGPIMLRSGHGFSGLKCSCETAHSLECAESKQETVPCSCVYNTGGLLIAGSNPATGSNLNRVCGNRLAAADWPLSVKVSVEGCPSSLLAHNSANLR
jgi:hypothetical protein